MVQYPHDVLVVGAGVTGEFVDVGGDVGVGDVFPGWECSEGFLDVDDDECCFCHVFRLWCRSEVWGGFLGQVPEQSRQQISITEIARMEIFPKG